MNHLRHRGLAVLLWLAASTNLSAQADSVRHRPLVTWKDLAILEAFAILTVAAAPLDERFAEQIQNRTVQENRAARNAAVFVETLTDPGAVVVGVGLYAVGRLSKNPKAKRAADLGFHGIEALAIGTGLGNLLKGTVGRARPYMDITRPHDYKTFRGFGGGSDYRSFPSGHTISAFAMALAMTSETKRWWPKSVWIVGPIMYGGATAVGLSRMYDNKHWASDVITGAAIGTFAGLKVVHWHHMKPGNRIDRIFLGSSVSATHDGAALVRLHFRPGF